VSKGQEATPRRGYRSNNGEAKSDEKIRNEKGLNWGSNRQQGDSIEKFASRMESMSGKPDVDSNSVNHKDMKSSWKSLQKRSSRNQKVEMKA
jgi:hypothetical protein